LLRESLCHYCYDALDRLIGHSQQGAQQHQRFYCKSRLATEIQGAMQCSILQHGDLLLAQQRREAGALDTTLLATDQQRSILHTLKANHQCQPIAYSPYGHHRHPENGLLSLLGFNGERPDPVTGHYLLGNGYRAFNPVLMRFNGPDSFSPFGRGGLNTYAYCLGDPINLSDPNGTLPQKPGFTYKSGQELTFSKLRVIQESNFTDVTEFEPFLDRKQFTWKEKTTRYSETNEGESVSEIIKDVLGYGHDEASIAMGGKSTAIKKNTEIKLKELSYKNMPGGELELFAKSGISEVDMANDNRNLWHARFSTHSNLSKIQVYELAEQGRLNGVRPSRANALIRENRYMNDDDRWWDDPTRYHTINK